MNTLRLATTKLNLTCQKAPSTTISRRMISLNHSKIQINDSKMPLIINAVGKDRVAVVRHMTKCVREFNGSIRGTPGIRLGNHFFELSMLADVPKNQVSDLMDVLKANNGTTDNLHATVYEASLNGGNMPAVDDTYRQRQQQQVVGYSGKIVIEGADSPKTMHKVTTLLRRNGLNIEDMESSDEIAPHGGTTLFRMEGVAHAYEPMSKGFNPQKIMRELEMLGNDLNCEISMTEAYRVDDDNWEKASEEDTEFNFHVGYAA